MSTRRHDDLSDGGICDCTHRDYRSAADREEDKQTMSIVTQLDTHESGRRNSYVSVFGLNESTSPSPAEGKTHERAIVQRLGHRMTTLEVHPVGLKRLPMSRDTMFVGSSR